MISFGASISGTRLNVMTSALDILTADDSGAFQLGGDERAAAD
jgi:hypothetical protein